MEENLKDQEVKPINATGGDIGDPKIQEIIKKAKGYETVLKNLIHGNKTRDEVIEMLKAGGDAITSVPQAAMTINDMGLATMKQGGITVEPSVQMVASAYLIDDLMELGEASQAFTLEEGSVDAIMEDTYQMYIERGLTDKSIDPIQLQLEAEQAMTEEQTAAGLVMGGGELPMRPTQQAMTEQYAQGKVNTKVNAMEASAAKKQGQEKQQALTQMATQQGGQQ
jgi:hypothetical protein